VGSSAVRIIHKQ